MTITQSPQTVLQAENVPAINADEAYALMKFQLECFLNLVETLAPDDWSQPTACTLWTVREILAHQAGGYASGTGYREFFRQVSHLPKPGQLPEDAINDLQVRERAGRSPAEMIAELRAVGPVAIQKWAYQFRPLKLLAIPHPVTGFLSMRYLFWTIHSRDTWMHRLDICRATGRTFEQTPEQDARIAALVMADVAKILLRKLGEVSIRFVLTGPAGGVWKIGAGEPSATIEMDVLDFNIFASGRYSYEEACSRAKITGDTADANQVLRNILVLF